MRIVNIGIDSGKYATKIAVERDGDIRHGKFKTRMDANVEKMSQDDAESFSVEFEGKRYLVGKEARTQDFEDTKMKDIHKIATYTAIASDFTGVGNGDHVNLAIGCPLTIYANRDLRMEYKKFIAPQGKEINIVVNGKRKVFTIDRSYVFPESSGVVYLNHEKYKEDLIGVIDIGGLNANCCIYDRGVPKVGTDTMFTLDLGGNVLSQTAATMVERTGTGKLADYLIEDMMAKNGLKKGTHAESAKIVHDCKLEHVQKIYDQCLHHNWNLEYTEIVFTGGAASWLKDEIIKVFPYYDIDNLGVDADFKNVDGFLKQLINRVSG